ncbi:MAG: acetyl-CoA decarbonylase/synthase complex subunit gamma [Planctomycetes bacterium]|nr:acetyl-CoA decarbonylase/synthase complex subunit gamma [Planctomycetota bacterium]
MALSGLEIFKLLPKTNCKKCGQPTCLAFAMALAQKKVSLEQCPDASPQAREALAAAAAPPMRLVSFGLGDAAAKTGQETVLFRHDEKFHSPTVVAATLPDDLPAAAAAARAKAIQALAFERVGQKMPVQAVAVLNRSGDAGRFAATAQLAKDTCKAVILVTQSPDAAKAALAHVKDAKPLLCGATDANAAAMAAIAKDAKCPLVAIAPDAEALAALTEKLKAAGCEDLVLCLETLDRWAEMRGLTLMRQLALKKNFRPLGYPVIAFAADGTPEAQVARASALIAKYAGIVVVDTIEPWALLPLLTVRQNIYTDPQKPVQVEPKLYAVGEAGADSPLMFTTNFSLTYYTVEGDVEASRVPSWILCVDTEGTSVLTAYSGDKLNEKIVAKAMKTANVETVVKHRKLIIPGYVAVMSGKLEEETGWEILVGPRESSIIPRYLKEVWAGQK